MMKTSRIALWILCLALVASCKKNGNTGNDVPENGFRAKIEQTKGGGSKGERTHINPEWGNENETGVYWSACDHIKVANQGGNGSTLTFQLTEGENTMYGTFYTGDPNEGFFEPDYMAAYPAANAEGTATPISGSTATFSMLSTQSFKANTFDEGAMPMVASSSTQTLDFRNVFGGLCIPLCGDGLTVTSVKLTSLNTTEKLWGVFTADCTSSNPVPAHVSGGDNTLTLECSGGVALDATVPTDFYFMVPPGTLESGFKVEAYNGNNKIYEKSTSSSPGSGFIPRSVVMKVNQSLQIVVTPLVVTTISPTFITKNSALGLGLVDNTPVSYGILYAKASNLATPADDLVIGGANVTNCVSNNILSTKRFDADLVGLEEDEVYFVRAWAANEAGTVFYGTPIPFATRFDYYSNSNNGRSRSVFTVRGDGTQVRFSMGNLQYQASTNTWRFADCQFDFVGNYDYGFVYEGGTRCNNYFIAEDYAGWIDLFGWGTSGINDYAPIATCWQPWSTSRDANHYNPYGSSYTQLYSNSGKADWGYNAILNGGNQDGNVSGRIQWRTPRGGNSSEWAYLLNNRTCTYRYSRAALVVRGTSNNQVSTVNGVLACGTGVNGLIIYPDDFSWPSDHLDFVTPYNTTDYWENSKLTEAQWSLLEQAGAIFLSCSGWRDGSTNVSNTNSDARYWSSTYYYNSYLAHYLYFYRAILRPNTSHSRHYGTAVRLVCPAE